MRLRPDPCWAPGRGAFLRWYGAVPARPGPVSVDKAEDGGKVTGTGKEAGGSHAIPLKTDVVVPVLPMKVEVSEAGRSQEALSVVRLTEKKANDGKTVTDDTDIGIPVNSKSKTQNTENCSKPTAKVTTLQTTPLTQPTSQRTEKTSPPQRAPVRPAVKIPPSPVDQRPALPRSQRWAATRQTEDTVPVS